MQPDLIDNRADLVRDVINDNLGKMKFLDISSGYFDVNGYRGVRAGLDGRLSGDQFRLRLLIGKDAIMTAEPETFEEYRDRAAASDDQSAEPMPVKRVLEETEMNADNMDDVSGLIALLRHERVHVRHNNRRFNHAKCYIMGDVGAVVGSSNFTGSGLVGNDELNVGIYQKTTYEKIEEWFERMWGNAEDSKQELIDVLLRSKFGEPPDPYEVYIKMLFEMYRPTLLAMDQAERHGIAPHLAVFQKDAVGAAMQIITDYNGVIVADSTGLGKTHIGLEIMRQKNHVENKKILLIAPSQVLKTVWTEKLVEAQLAIKTETMEGIGRMSDRDLIKLRDVDLVVIDESQNFRSKGAARRENLMKLMTMAPKKQAVLLSATPINNSVMDLYYQLLIIARGNNDHFQNLGIPDLYAHMRKAANKDGLAQGLEKIQQILDAVMVRRTRTFIKNTYKNESINGAGIRFPKRDYLPIRYSLKDIAKDGIYEDVFITIESLHMVPYGFDRYNNTLDERDKHRHHVLAHLQVIMMLKRFESSMRAISISIRNKIRLYVRVMEFLSDGRIPHTKELNKIMARWSSREMEGDTEMEDSEGDTYESFMKKIGEVPTRPAEDYDMELINRHMGEDIKKLRDLEGKLQKISGFDKKIDAVAEQILADGALDRESRKVLVFTEYSDTAAYVRDELARRFEKKNVLLMTGDTGKDLRQDYLSRFAPKANPRAEGEPEKEADILVSTEVLAEGQNLQDCNYVVNYDLPWNPMRIVQRIGRIDRLTSRYKEVHSRECYPDVKLDRLINLVGKLMKKISDINDTVGLDAELLGTEASPKQFNGSTVKRIRALAGSADGDAAEVIERLEGESDLMPVMSPLNEISRYVRKEGIKEMMSVPLGRRSGKRGESPFVILGYLEKGRVHRYHSVKFDYKTKRAEVVENSDAMKSASCTEAEPRHLPMDTESDFHESFGQLLAIDRLARDAIVQKDRSIVETVKRGREGSDKNRTRMKKIIKDALRAGRVEPDTANKIYDVAGSSYLRMWDSNVGVVHNRHLAACFLR